MKQARTLRAGDVQLYRVCEDLSEPLIYFMVLFSPWAFGTTQAWAIWTMNVAGYLLGALLLAKLAVRHGKGYRPPRWNSNTEDSRSKIEDSDLPSPIFHLPSSISPLPSPARALATLTVLILGYCLISAVNARSTYHRQDLSFQYHRYVAWLPHSFDSGRTWFAFWGYLSLACAFWAVRDWLLDKTDGEERAARQAGQKSEVRSQKSEVSDQTSGHESKRADGRSQIEESHLPSSISHLPKPAPLIPTRLRRLLWVLAVNGGLLAVEGIVQRLEGSGRLLFLVKPRVNPAGETQFGPWAYRANASAYFNLLWPVCLGFWWTLHRDARPNSRSRAAQPGGPVPASHRHHLLLACAAVMAACPIISTSRGGALVTVGLALATALLMMGSPFLFAEPARVRVRKQGAKSREQSARGKNIEKRTFSIQHRRATPEEECPQTPNPEPRTSEAAEGTPSPGGEGRPVLRSSAATEDGGEGGPGPNIQHPTSNIQHRTVALARVEGGSTPRVENRKSKIENRKSEGLVLLCLAAALVLGCSFGWKALKPRMAQLSEGFEGREQMYEAARPMASDYPLFGTGPGTFESVFQLYRITTDTYWPAQLHNDWLETRITFGWAGSGLIGLALATVALRWFGRGGIHGGRRFTVLIWLALAGCLVHARYDFPFQIYSIALLFLVVCAVLFDLSRSPQARGTAWT